MPRLRVGWGRLSLIIDLFRLAKKSVAVLFVDRAVCACEEAFTVGVD